MTIYEKLSAIQAEIKSPKARWNSFSGFSYRSFEDIVEAAKPVCKAHKTVFYLSEDVVQIGDRFYFKATAVLQDLEKSENGAPHIVVTAFAREALAKTKFDEAQVSGATSAYAKKMALADLFALDSEDDPDSGDNGKTPAGSAQRLTDELKAESRPTEPKEKKIAPRAPQNATEGKAIATVDEMAQIKAKISAAKARTGLSQKDIFSKIIAAKFAYDKSASAFYSADFQKVCGFIDGLQGEEAEPLPWNE